MERSQQLEIAYRLWAENANRKHGGQGLVFVDKYYHIQLVFAEAGGPSANLANYTNLVAEAAWKLCSGALGRIDFMIAAYSSTYAAVIGDICDSYSVPIVTGNAAGEDVYRCKECASCYPTAPHLPPTCSHVGDRRFKWSISLDAQAKNYFPLYVSLMKIKGVVTLGLFYEDTSFPIASAAGVRMSAALFNVQIVVDERMSPHVGYLPSEYSSLDPKNYPTLDATLTKELDDLVDVLIQADPDAIGSSHPPSIPPLLLSILSHSLHHSLSLPPSFPLSLLRPSLPLSISFSLVC